MLCTAQIDPSPAVRKVVATFLSEASLADPGVPTLHQSAVCLLALLADQAAGVVKQAVLACASVLRVALAVYASRVGGHQLLLDRLNSGIRAPRHTDSLPFAQVVHGVVVGMQPSEPDRSALWAGVRKMLSAACTAAQQHKSDSVKLSAAKLMEQVVLMFTAESVPGLPGGWVGG